MRRVFVVGDVHANGRALRAALQRVDAAGTPNLVFLGDLLTYGPDVDEVVSLVADRTERGATLLRGNHDALYEDLMAGEAAYYDGLPSWIRASVDATVEALDTEAFRALPFVDQHVVGMAFFAHANPFGDWRYLNSDADHREAGEALLAAGHRAGVFGHTHRSRVVELPSGRGLGDDALRTLAWRPKGPQDVLILNAGAIGQPRNRSATTTLLEVRIGDDEVHASVSALSFDVDAHIRATEELGLGPEATARLVGFFRPQGP